LAIIINGTILIWRLLWEWIRRTKSRNMKGKMWYHYKNKSFLCKCSFFLKCVISIWVVNNVEILYLYWLLHLQLLLTKLWLSWNLHFVGFRTYCKLLILILWH
jgi:hypothetical protein